MNFTIQAITCYFLKSHFIFLSLWNCLSPRHIYQIRSSFVFFLFLGFQINVLSLHSITYLLVQLTTSISQVLHLTFSLILGIEVWLKISHPFKAYLWKEAFRCLSTNIRSYFSGNHTSTTSLSWLWRKRFVPEITCFVSF